MVVAVVKLLGWRGGGGKGCAAGGVLVVLVAMVVPAVVVDGCEGVRDLDVAPAGTIPGR